MSRRYHPYTRPSAPARSTASILSNAQGVTFHGNPTFYVNDPTSIPTEGLPEAEGITILRQKVAIGATHNSGERFDPPKCHPGTRIALQDDVYRWVDEPHGGRLVTWLFGPAGAGKSAIAQTISEKLLAEGKLTASFFFSRRESASQGRGDESALIATLAYQLSLSIPATKPFIARAVHENPLIFDLSLDDQVQALITGPLTCVYRDNLARHCTRLIVVDGLDECRKDDNAQHRVVSALIKGISGIPYRRHKLFITSRPEHNIVASFRDYKPDLLRKMELNNTWNPDEDIQTFLISEFANIRRSHPYFESHSTDQTWPSSADINVLVERSSGQFIYASVVIKYIRSDDYYDPAARLEVILQLENNEDRPYAELDALYQHIFSQIRGIEKVLNVLSVERIFAGSKFDRPPSLALFLTHLTGASAEEIKFLLRHLVSLLTCETQSEDIQIRYLHASLPDFLADESRSNMFCITSLPIATRVVQQALDLLKKKETFAKNVDFIPILLTIPRHYSKKLSLRKHVFSLLTDFDFVDIVLSQIHLGSLLGTSPPLPENLVSMLGSYLKWVLAESESDPTKALVKPLSQISTWIIKQLMCKSIDQLDGTEQVDMWSIFRASAVHALRSGIVSKIQLQCRMFQDTAAALEIYGLSSLSHQVTWDKSVEVSDEAALFHHLIPYISQWLDNTTLLGQHAITGERCTAIFLRISSYILRLPKYQLEAILTTNFFGQFSRISSIFVAWKTFCANMDHLPLSMELYFFVLYMESVVVNYYSCRHDDHTEDPFEMLCIYRVMRRYLRLMREGFPFLSYPASPEYIKAQVKAKATWIETKRDLYDPILSVWVEELPDLEFDFDSDTSARTSSRSSGAEESEDTS